MHDPNDDPLDDRPDQDQLPEPEQEDRTRTLIPRTVTTAAAWLEARAEAERILNLPAVVTVRAALSRYTCLSCGDALPAGRGGHCEACVSWGD